MYTPEIIKANEQMRLENRELEIAKLLKVVEEGDSSNSLAEIRPALELALGRTLEEYVAQVQQTKQDGGDITWTDSDVKLASVLETQLTKS